MVVEEGFSKVQRRLQQLISFPREDLDIEVKNWLDLSEKLHQADLAQALIAIANHGGGFVLIGYSKKDGILTPTEKADKSLDDYNHDIINNIVEKYAEPSFHCNVEYVKHEELEQVFPVIIVPGNHQVPIRTTRDGPNRKHVQKDKYYIRRPGPKSEPPRTGREWNELISRCLRSSRDDLLQNIRDIFYGEPSVSKVNRVEEEEYNLQKWIDDSINRWNSLVKSDLSNEIPSRYSNGIWYVAYSILGEFKQPSSAELMQILRDVEGHETGWPAWLVLSREDLKPYPYDGLIECWIKSQRFRIGAHSDFWRASPSGFMFLLRGYEEDGLLDNSVPGSNLDLILPVWRIGECLLHAKRLTSKISSESSIHFQVTWEGLMGRTLNSLVNRRRHIIPYRKSRQDKVSSEIVVTIGQIEETLPEIVRSITQPLYETFDFFTPPPSMYSEELNSMMKRI